ncbi:hypothetical protein [Ostreiculturibacter nitratireducens]|uniref:hypothetical protein n=1 Tax=Ostreiculturibacter nitratireducens TaxID=3075226 RepID=UPI0031B60710
MFGQAMMMGASGGLAFDPSTALVWLDPSDLSTLWQDTAGTIPVTADGQPVARINNKGTAGGFFSQGGASYRPLYKASGGLHWLQADGSNDCLNVASRFALGADPDLTVVVGLMILANKTADDRFWVLGGPKPTTCLAGACGSDGWSWRYNGGALLFGASDIGVSHVGTWRRGAGDLYGDARFFLDGAEKLVVTSVNPGLAPSSTSAYCGIHGESAQSAGNPGNHRIYGVILMNADDDAKQAAAEEWMATKAGVAL